MESMMMAMTMDEHDDVSSFIEGAFEIYDEIDGAKEYIEKALKMKVRDRSAADSLCTMSAQELQHAETLRLNAERTLLRMKDEKSPCYEVLQKVWNHMARRQAEYMGWVRQMHEQYKK